MHPQTLPLKTVRPEPVRPQPVRARGRRFGVVRRLLSTTATLAVALAATACSTEGQVIRVDLQPNQHALVRIIGSAPRVTVTNEGPGAVATRLYHANEAATSREYERLVRAGSATQRTFLGPALVDIVSSADDEATVAIKLFGGTEVAVQREPESLEDYPAESPPAPVR